MDWLTPFQFPFMQNAFLIGLVIAVPTALLSCFLVLKGWALMGDAISHAVLPGIVIAYFLGWPLILGAFASGMVCALLTGYLSENSRVKPDTVMGVVFSGMFALGIVLFVALDTQVHLEHLLFGNVLGVSGADLAASGLIALCVTALLVAKWRDLLLASFDPAQARASGLAVGWLHYGLLGALSLTIVATLSATGLILAIGLLIAPGATAFLLVRRFSAMLLVAVALNLMTLLAGIYLSFFIDSAPAPTVVLVQSAVFLAAYVRRLLLNRRRSRRIEPAAKTAA